MEWVKKTLRILAFLIGSLLMMVVGLVGLGVYWNHQAGVKAHALCDRIPVGANELEILALTTTLQAHRIQHTAEKQVFQFPGWVFNAVFCEIKIVKGQVMEKNIIEVWD